MDATPDTRAEVTCAAAVTHWIATQGIDTLYELSGGMIAYLIDAAYAHPALRVLELRHEQSAAYAAAGQAILTGQPSVALGTAGPGALNLIAGIAQAWVDSLPVLFLVGQVPTHMQLGVQGARQWGIQETPFLDLVRPMTKSARSISTASEALPSLDAALRAALSGRPGPVVVEIPFDIQGQKRTALSPTRAVPEPAPARDTLEIARWLAPLAEAARPLILAGGGLHTACSADAFRAFATTTGLPVVATLRGLDLLPSNHPQMLGMVGIEGVRRANMALAESDCLLVLGARLDPAVTAGNPHWMGRNRTVLQLDCDPAELGARIDGTQGLQGDLAAALPALQAWADAHPMARAAWLDTLAEIARVNPVDEPCGAAPGSIDPKPFLRSLSDASAAACAYVLDAGNYTWWSCHALRLDAGQRLITGGGLMAMGFGLPAALGVAFSQRAPVVAIVGDGGLQCAIQELEVIQQAQLPVKLVVFNNNAHGAVRQFQDVLFDGRHSGTVEGYSAPDFSAVARAYGIAAQRISAPSDVDRALVALWRDPDAPALLEVMIDPSANAVPEVPMGAPLNRMRPARPRR